MNEEFLRLATKDAIVQRLDRIEALLAALVAALAEEEDESPGFDLDGNPNRPNRDPHEEL